MKMFDIVVLVSKHPVSGGLQVCVTSTVVFAYDKEHARELIKKHFAPQDGVYIESLREFIPLENPGVMEVGLTRLLDSILATKVQ